MFYDRRQAGRQLAEQLMGYRAARPVVLGLPRGGLPVAYEVAVALKAPLDVLVARKIGAPMQPEFAIGAVAPGGVLFLNRQAVEDLDIDNEALRRLVLQKQAEVEDRNRRYRGSDVLPEIKGRTVILVDDGIATGLTVMAAVRAVRKEGPQHVVLAVPVSSFEAAEWLREEVDNLVCLIIPEELVAVGSWYGQFETVSDEEVTGLLHKARTLLGSNS